MGEIFEKNFVQHTSATLKGYKAGSLFSYRPSCNEKFEDALQTLDAALSKKGIRICAIDRKHSSRLIFVYRPKMIDAMLSRHEFQCFLCQFGYPVDKGHEANVPYLLMRMKKCQEFPTRSACFWVILLKMYWVLLLTRAKIMPYADFGRYMHNQKKQRNASICFKDAGSTA